MAIFAIYLQFYMWFYKGIKVIISATTQKFIVALIYKTNPVQITKIIAENSENSLNSVPHTIESSIQNCEKSSPIVKLNLAFSSSATAIVSLLLLIALTQSIKRSSNKLLIQSIVRRSTPKCYKHATSFHPYTLCSLVLQMQLEASYKVNKS